LKDLPAYSGLQNREDRTLYAFRCRPKDATKLSPILATWPAVFDLIRKDLADRGPCGDVATSPENELYCAVRDFEDRAVPSSTASVYQALARAMKVQEAPSRADVLKTRYGIYQEFSGLGYSVKLYGNYDPMTAQVVLGNSMVPEFLVKNVTPAEGDCSCIRVPTYDGRGNDPLDPDFILEAGSAACNEVPRLAKAKAASNP
jgi:hypothetical protein